MNHDDQFTTEKKLFESSVQEIVAAIVSDLPPDSDEISIVAQFELSTKTLRNYVTLDWHHAQDIRKTKEVILNYARDHTRTRPLNILMMASPGSGKSHFVKCLANVMNENRASAVTFNMATLRSVDDFTQPLEMVRNLKISDRLPILFLDEFESSPANIPFLLPLMYDGELHVGHQDLKLGKLVIMLAGSSPWLEDAVASAKNFRADLETDKYPPKLFDFLSRINGGNLDLPDLELVTKTGDKQRDRRADKICLALHMLVQRFPNLECVPWNFIHWIGVTKFRHGVRSLGSLIDLIPHSEEITDKLLPSHLHLPLASSKEVAESSLVYHLLGEQNIEITIENWKEFSDVEAMVRFRSGEV